jgi:CheY-like chemotaxis protein
MTGSLGTILFADDDHFFHAGLIDELQDAGYKVLYASDQARTLEILEGEQIDLLILDIMMPTGNSSDDPDYGATTGIKTAELIRDVLKSTLPIIFLTVYSDEAIRSFVSKIGGESGLPQRMLSKPILGLDLVAEVKDMLSPK